MTNNGITKNDTLVNSINSFLTTNIGTVENDNAFYEIFNYTKDISDNLMNKYKNKLDDSDAHQIFCHAILKLISDGTTADNFIESFKILAEEELIEYMQQLGIVKVTKTDVNNFAVKYNTNRYPEPNKLENAMNWESIDSFLPIKSGKKSTRGYQSIKNSLVENNENFEIAGDYSDYELLQIVLNGLPENQKGILLSYFGEGDENFSRVARIFDRAPSGIRESCINYFDQVEERFCYLKLLFDLNRFAKSNDVDLFSNPVKNLDVNDLCEIITDLQREHSKGDRKENKNKVAKQLKKHILFYNDLIESGSLNGKSIKKILGEIKGELFRYKYLMDFNSKTQQEAEK